MAHSQPWLEASTNRVRAVLKDELGAAVTGAVVDVTIREMDGTAVTGGPVWPLAMPEEATLGTYSVTIAEGVLVLGQRYRVEVNADDGGTKRQSQPTVRVTRDTD